MIKIGLIGSINQVIPHVEVISKIPGIEIAGYFSPVDELFNEWYDKKLKYIRRFEDLLSVSDALDFVSEDKKSLKLALQALKASKHVLLKPSIIENKNQTNQLTKLANEAHVVLMIENLVKFHAALNAALPLMKNLRLIEIQKQLPVKEKHTSENILKSLLQDLDIIHTVLKSNLKNFKTTGVKMINGNADIVNVRLEYDNGCVANLNCSWLVKKENYIGLFTQQDRITKVDFLTNEITILKPVVNGNDNREFALKPVTEKIIQNNPSLEELVNFIQTIKNSAKVISNPEDGFKSFFIAERIIDDLNKILSN